jgi:arylsulfatase
VLPIAEPRRPVYTEIDARNVKAPPRFEVKAPARAPNVVIVLIDDMGFGVPSTFGGPVSMPTLDKLAQNGLRYNNFHTTALCSPTRAALKSGRNHHTLNMGFITEMATGMPGNTGQIPDRGGEVALHGADSKADRPGTLGGKMGSVRLSPFSRRRRTALSGKGS